MKKQILAIVLLVGVLGPNVTFAAKVTTSVNVVSREVWDRIVTLKAEIATLSAQVEAMRGAQAAGAISAISPVTPTAVSNSSVGCVNIARALYKGVKGSDVANLQTYLVAYPGVTWPAAAGITGYYGSVTAEAVSFFQTKEGLGSFSGVVDKATADAISRRSCGN